MTWGVSSTAVEIPCSSRLVSDIAPVANTQIAVEKQSRDGVDSSVTQDPRWVGQHPILITGEQGGQLKLGPGLEPN